MLLEGEQPRPDRVVGAGAHHAGGHQRQLRPGSPFDDTEPAPGEAGIHAEHPHAAHHPVPTEHMFGRALPGRPAPGRRHRGRRVAGQKLSSRRPGSRRMPLSSASSALGRRPRQARRGAACRSGRRRRARRSRGRPAGRPGRETGGRLPAIGPLPAADLQRPAGRRSAAAGRRQISSPTASVAAAGKPRPADRRGASTSGASSCHALQAEVGLRGQPGDRVVRAQHRAHQLGHGGVRAHDPTTGPGWSPAIRRPAPAPRSRRGPRASRRQEAVGRQVTEPVQVRQPPAADCGGVRGRRTAVAWPTVHGPDYAITSSASPALPAAGSGRPCSGCAGPVRRQQRGDRASPDHPPVQPSGQLPAQRAVQRRGGRIQHRQGEPRSAITRSTRSSARGRCRGRAARRDLDPADARHRHRPAVPPLPHVGNIAAPTGRGPSKAANTGRPRRRALASARQSGLLAPLTGPKARRPRSTSSSRSSSARPRRSG